MLLLSRGEPAVHGRFVQTKPRSLTLSWKELLLQKISYKRAPGSIPVLLAKITIVTCHRIKLSFSYQNFRALPAYRKALPPGKTLG